MVVTARPSAWTASMVQDLTLLPSTRTTQAPHWLVSHPTCVPVSRNCSRRNCTSRVLGSTSSATHRPFTVIDTVTMARGLQNRMSTDDAHQNTAVGRPVKPLFQIGPGSTATTRTAGRKSDHDDERRNPDRGREALLGGGPRRNRRVQVRWRSHGDDRAELCGRNRRAILRAVVSTRRDPICASLPPTVASTSYLMTVPSPSGTSDTVAAPLANPAGPPWLSPVIRQPFGASISVSRTLPWNLALTGPTTAVTAATSSPASIRSRVSQPGILRRRTSGVVQCGPYGFARGRDALFVAQTHGECVPTQDSYAGPIITIS